MWFSHGHPDHLNPHSVQRFRGHRILLPDHVGGRIRSDLEREGFDVSVLPDRKWVELSPRIRVFCIPDFIQDAALLIEINDSLFLNLNDSSVRGYAGLVRRMAKRYPRSYVMRLSGGGDADMINLFDEEGNRIPFRGNPTPGGKQLSDLARMWGTNHAIPFSSFHRYQRADSVWANQHATPLDSYREGFDSTHAEWVQPFVFVDADSGDVTPLSPASLPERILAPDEFGDR